MIAPSKYTSGVQSSRTVIDYIGNTSLPVTGERVHPPNESRGSERIADEAGLVPMFGKENRIGEDFDACEELGSEKTRRRNSSADADHACGRCKDLGQLTPAMKVLHVDDVLRMASSSKALPMAGKDRRA